MRPNCNIHNLFLIGLAFFDISQSQAAWPKAAGYANNRSLGVCATLGAGIFAQYCYGLVSLDSKLNELYRNIDSLEPSKKVDLNKIGLKPNKNIVWNKNLNKYEFGTHTYTDYSDLRIKWDLAAAQKEKDLAADQKDAQFSNNYGWWDRLRNYFNR